MTDERKERVAGDGAEEVYALALGQLEEGQKLDMEALCAAHPELIPELRRLERICDRIHAFVDRLGDTEGLSEQFRSAIGFQDQCDDTERDSQPGGAEWLSPELFERLQSRKASFARYQIQGEVARGGQGAVMRIWDDELRRVLAMKRVLPKTRLKAPDGTPRMDPHSIGRFLEEAQVTSQLDHPGIVPVHELGLDPEDRLYFTMKLVRGDNLTRIFERVAAGEGEWNLARAVGVMLRACEAMAYAHSKGVIHRDLKPDNVMVGQYGEVYVMDWGLSRVAGTSDTKDVRIRPRGDRPRGAPDETEVVQGIGQRVSVSPLYTMDGAVVGTPAYMPPEQAHGKTDEVGPHSDVYAAGAMIYHLLSGHMPYVQPATQPDNYEVWRRVQAGPPRPVHEDSLGAPAELVAICEKAMARDWRERYPDMQAMAGDLRAYLEHRVVVAYRTGALVEFRKWVARNRKVAVVVAVALVAVLGVGFLKLAAERRAADVLRSRADEHLANALVREVRQSWPVHPDQVEAMGSWIERAQPLVAQWQDRASAAPEAALRGDTEQGEESFPIRNARAALALCRSELAGAREELETEGLDFERGARLEHGIPILEGEVPFYEAELAALLRERDRSKESEFMQDLELLAAALDGVRARHRAASDLEESSIEAWAHAWEACSASIADPDECPLYGGLELAPQLGLVPLQQDLDSGLWEFWHPLSGEMPEVGSEGELVVTGATGMIYVLVPGHGDFAMGEQSRDPAVPNYDPRATSEISAIRMVVLAPYFLSKYEMTQGQWLRLTGDLPSEHRSGYEYSGRYRLTRAHPVEQISFNEAQRHLRQWNLEIPTEAQWERAARAGTQTRYSTGRELASLQGMANLQDRSLLPYGNANAGVVPWDDGFPVHSPVDAFPPNAFGMHGMAGNVAELTRDWHCADLTPKNVASVVPETGELVPMETLTRTVRGGGYSLDSSVIRVARRMSRFPRSPANWIGVRPALAVISTN